MKQRLRLTRTLNRPGYADLHIDNLRFTVSNIDLMKLAEDLAQLLETLAEEKRRERN